MAKVDEQRESTTSKKIWRKLFHRHKFHLVSLFFGASILLVFLINAFIFYHLPESQRKGWIIKSLDHIHSLSIDLKQKLRGPMNVDSKLALIAIDEYSLKQVGRWPWSRDKLATIVQQLFDSGVENIGIDILLTESENEEILKWFEEQKKTYSHTQAHRLIKNSVKKFDVDHLFSESLKQYGERIILPITYKYRWREIKPYQEVCYKKAYQKTPFFKALEDEGYDFISVSQESFPSLPPPVETLLDQTLEPMSFKEAEKYCSHWLIQNRDSNYLSFESDWPQNAKLSLDDYKESFLWSALFPAGEWLTSADKLNQAARYSGFINIHPDKDGTVRTTQLLVQSGEHIIPSMALRLAMLMNKADSGQVILKPDPHNPEVDLIASDLELTFEGESIRSIATDDNTRFMIQFAGRQYSYPQASIGDLLNKEKATIRVHQRHYDPLTKKWQFNQAGKQILKEKFLKGKTVIVGATAAGLYDLRVTPFDENIPGPEVHLNILDNIINNNQLLASKSEPLWMYLALISIGLLLSLSVILLPNVISSLIFVTMMAFILLIDYHFFFSEGLIIAIWLPSSLATFTFFGVTIFDHFKEEQNRKELRKTFESYVSPSIVNEVLEDPENIKLGGRRVFMSVLFSDVRGFTTISETLTPEQLSDVLNIYLTPMTDLVFANKGTLDKYMGDAVMAFFGAPIEFQTHAEDACRCALMSLDELEKINEKLKGLNFPTLDAGFGVNTGYMSVGNMGSETVRNYTVMGDAVNLGSRLEGINKQYGTRIIISEFTKDKIGSQFFTREIDWVRVKGKKEPVKIYELMGENQLPSKKDQLLPLFNKGFAAYHDMNFVGALGYFEECLRIDAEDKVSQLYIQRSKDYLSVPPPKDWDGVFTMTTK